MRKKSINQLWRMRMNKNFWKDLVFEFKEWKRRRKAKKNRKSYDEISKTRATKNEFDADQASIQWTVNRKFKG